MHYQRVGVIIASTMLLIGAVVSCVDVDIDKAELAKSIKPNEAHADEAVSPLDDPSNKKGSTLDGTDAASVGKVHLLLSKEHVISDLDVNREAANPAEREAIPFELKDEGTTLRLELEKNVTHRFIVRSSKEGALRCEVHTDFDLVEALADFDRGTVVIVPLEEEER